MELVSLTYQLVADVEVQYYGGADSSSTTGPQRIYSAEWMYDEVDVGDDGLFEHRVLLSLQTAGPSACCMRFRFSCFEYGVALCEPLWSEE